MKNLLIAVSVLALVACKKEENKTEENSISGAISSAKNLNSISNAMDDINKNIETLKKTAPLSNDELKGALPENLAGLKRTELTVGDQSMMQISSAEAKYGTDNKEISVRITDGAGETGSAMISIVMMGHSATLEKTTENGFEKIGEFNGKRMSIKETKETDRVDSEIQFIEKNRYLVDVEGDGFTYEELAKAIGELNLSALK